MYFAKNVITGSLFLFLAACNPNPDAQQHGTKPAAKHVQAWQQGASTPAMGVSNNKTATNDDIDAASMVFSDNDISDASNFLKGEARKLARENQMTDNETAELLQEAERLGALIQQADQISQSENTSTSAKDTALYMADFQRQAALTAHAKNQPYSDAATKKMYEKIKKTAPNLNIQAVVKSDFFPEFAHVLMIDNDTNAPYFMTYSVKYEYFIFPDAGWGLGFFRKDGSGMNAPEEIAQVVSEFAGVLQKMQTSLSKAVGNKKVGVFHTLSDNAHKDHVNDHAFILSDAECANCAKTEKGLQGIENSNAPYPVTLAFANNGAMTLDNAQKTGMDKFVGFPATAMDLTKQTLFSITNCHTEHGLSLDYEQQGKITTRVWKLEKQTPNKAQSHYKQCGRESAKIQALTMMFGIKPINLPLLVTTQGNTVSGAMTKESVIESMKGNNL